MAKAYEVAAEAVVAARRLGWVGNVKDRLLTIVRRSAPVTHPDGNRRFDEFVLRVEDDTVRSIRRMVRPADGSKPLAGKPAPLKDAAPAGDKGDKGDKSDRKKQVEAAIALHFPKPK